MVRTMSIFGTASLLCGCVSLAAGQSVSKPDPHIRMFDPQLTAALTLGTRMSPTLDRLVEEIEHSDLIVYVMFERARQRAVAAHVGFMTAAGGRRYVHVALDPALQGPNLIGMLAHELQHAAEIARAPSVVDERSLAALYLRIGVDCARNWLERRFDSAAAIEVGARVTRDARDGFRQLAGTGVGSGAGTGCNDVCR
ncbi:MAG TPA: hypothetical protein VKE51_28440 [Vicinamibacterales bacterium]|nr:hypothetical protein [Vicinamibacterales bacterium]